MTITASYDTFQIQLLREGKAYRDEIGEPDQDLDDLLARAEASVVRPAFPVADEPSRGPRTTTGYGTRPSEPATEKQIGYLNSLVAKAGLDPADYRPTSKQNASELIDRVKLIIQRGGNRAAAPVTAPARLATEGQISYLRDLRDLWATREHTSTQTADEIDWASMEFQTASILIESMKDLPRRSTRTEHSIRPGRYAFEPKNGPAQFYRVSRNGRVWVQAGPAEHPYTGKLNEALQAIQADPKSHAALYGRLIGTCGRCGLELTDETSRSIGLGPVCAGKSEW